MTVEILPGGFADGSRTVVNISDLAQRSDYRVDLAEGDNPLTGTKARACTVYVRNHDRAQSVWSLIAAGIAEASSS